jgi:hypothetical protein
MMEGLLLPVVPVGRRRRRRRPRPAAAPTASFPAKSPWAIAAGRPSPSPYRFTAGRSTASQSLRPRNRCSLRIGEGPALQPFKCSQQVMLTTRKLPLQLFLSRRRRKRRNSHCCFSSVVNGGNEDPPAAASESARVQPLNARNRYCSPQGKSRCNLSSLAAPQWALLSWEIPVGDRRWASLPLPVPLSPQAKPYNEDPPAAASESAVGRCPLITTATTSNSNPKP